MATAETVGIVRRSLSPRSSPRASPRTSPGVSPRVSPRRSPRKGARGATSHDSGGHLFSKSSKSSTPYYHSFQEAHWLTQILAELLRKDSELLNLLRSNRTQHVPKVLAHFEETDEKQALISSYQEFLNFVVCLIAESVFLEKPELVSESRDPQGIVKALSGKKCPDLSIFCRLVLQPSQIASAKPDAVCSEKFNGIPVNQLARFCDVAVLDFLNRTNEHTKPHAVLWAINYVSDLLHSLIYSIANHSSPGWYGAPTTRQKKTVSVNVPPAFLQAPPPMVVVVGSPPPLDPETGQSRVQSGSASSFPFPPQDEPRHSPQLSPTGNLFHDQGSHHSESGDSSPGSRKPSPVDLTISPTWSANSSPMLSPQLSRKSTGHAGDSWSNVGGATGMLGSGLRPRSPRLAELKLNKPQSIPEEEEEEDQVATTAIVERRVPTTEEGEEEEGEDEGGEEEMKAKPLDDQQTAPSIDIKAELKTCMNAEGRISLIAILQAIAQLSQSDIIWTERFGMNCFQLIQHCMDLGLTQAAKSDESTSSSQKRRRFQKQENVAFRTHGQERPCHAHSKYVVHYAVHALIQCATNLLIGCSHDGQQTCWLAYKRVSTQNNLIHPRLLRHLNRIHCHSPQEFQQVMMHFASAAPLRKILNFLHVVLEYCQQASADNVDSLMLSITASVLRTLIDRLARLNLSKPSLQEGLLTDVCLFFQYTQTLFSFHTQLDSYRHFYMYIHRVALSVILPEQETKTNHQPYDSTFNPFPAILEETESLHDSVSATATSQPSPGLATRGTFLSQSLPRRHKNKTASDEKPRPRSSIHSDHVIMNKSPKGHRRGLFTKQHSIHEREDSNLTLQGSGSELNVYMEEWRRLKLNVLRHRIRRLVVLMDLSEPGTVPDPGMLASLIDLSDGTLVVARAMVLLECALFVHNLRNKEGTKRASHWLRNRQGGTQRISVHLKRWAVAVAEKLRIVELRERDMIQRLRNKGGGGTAQSIVLPEEPVLPESPAEQQKPKSSDGGSGHSQTVSFGIKMCVCVLLYEITHYLRENASNAPAVLGTTRVSVTNLDRRRPSVVSTTSTDTDAVATPTSGATGLLQHSLDSKVAAAVMRRNRLNPDGHSSSMEEDVLHSVRRSSLDEGGSFEDDAHAKVPQKKVSVYLRVNSAVDSREVSRGRRNSGLKQTINVKSSTAASRLTEPTRRPSVSVGRRHVSFYEKSTSDRPVIKERPSAVTVNTLRPLPGRAPVQTSHSFQESPDSGSLSGSFHRPTLQSQGSTASQRTQNLGAQIQSGISRLARRAFRGKIRRKTTATGPRKTSLTGGSPNLIQRRRPQRLSTAGLVALGTEDDKHFFPWIDIIEHLVIVDALNPESHARHARACTELVTALNHVYALREGNTEAQGVNRTTLNEMFSGAWDPFFHQRGRSGPLNQGRGNQLRHTGKAKPPRSVSRGFSQSTSSSISSSQSLALLDFSQIRRSVFSSPSSSRCTAIELFLEQDSPQSEIHNDTEFNGRRRCYMQRNFSGLVHAPFSLLVYTAPMLSKSSFTSLMDVAWDMLLDRNQEMSQAAGQFFLLAAAKEGEAGMKEFFTRTVEKGSAVQQREAVVRFSTLWRCRYKVWPAVGERGQKKFNSERGTEERQDQQTIGYSLPANLLGSAGRDVPVPPWSALSLCVHDDCQTNPDKCYRATRLAPLKHCKEVSEAVEGFSVSGISIPLEADSKPTSVFAGVGSEDNAGNININQWEAVEPTLFPPSLLPLITFVISSLTPHPSHHGTNSTSSRAHTSPSFPLSLNRSELAYQSIKQCMTEDPRLLFRPLLNRFNKLYQDISDRTNRYPASVFIKSLKDTLHPLHITLQAFPSLPPKAAHFLFNNFVGIITRHTDQPCTFSSEIIQSVLLLLTMVIPSMKGLDLKALKSTLKKESCYTTILTTARIRGTEKINIIDETTASSGRSISGIAHDQFVGDDDTFGQVIARFKGTQLSYDLLQHLYLVDQNKDLPVLSTLVVKDHYSMLTDKQHPTFILRDTERGSGSEVWSWGDQLNQLFVHKMSEVLRVLMSLKLLATGPEVERGSSDLYNKFAQPNYRFFHQELVALTSFPRQSLTSILYEAGPATLAHPHLHSSDNMLMGTWVKFVLELFLCAKPDYEWGNSLALFVNVINGALLLYSEDLSILRQALAALIVVATKFVHVFRRQGYEMVIPTLVQVYASHMNNALITNALKFVWGQFYLLNLNSNVFLLQAIAATAILLSDEAAKLSMISGTPLSSPALHSQQLDPVVVQHNNARAAFQLLESLDSETAPADHLHIMSNCTMEHQLDAHWQPLSLQTIFYLCITVASWNPEAVRGMQVLVFLDHLIPMFLNAISLPRTSSFVLESMKSLVKGCDTITKPQSWKGDFLSRRETQRTDTQQNLDIVGGGPGRDDLLNQPLEQSLQQPERRTSAVARIYRRIVNPSKKLEVSEGSAYFTHSSLDRAATSMLPPIGHQEYVGEFKRRLQATSQRVLQLSRESLLSLSSKLVSHEASLLKERSQPGSRVVVRVDPQTTSYLTAIAVQLLKLGGTNEVTLTAQGLCCFMDSLLPNVEWTEAHFGCFHSIINRLVKLYRMLCRVRITLAWDSLGIFLKGVTQCIKISPQLAAHEPIFTKLKMLLEVIVNSPSQGGGGGQEGPPSQSRGGQKRPLLHYAPTSFNDTIVRLVSQLLITTKDVPNPRLQYHLSDLLSQRLVIKDTIVPKILLPLFIHLGMREDLEKLPVVDLDFLLELLDKRVENILKLCHPPLHPSHFMDPARSDIPADMFCRAIKVICCAFSDSFTLHDWSRVAQWIMSLSLRKLEGVHLSSQSQATLERSGSDSSVLSSASGRSARHTSVTGQHNYDSYLAFYTALLVHVYENLLSVHRIPLCFFLWPLLTQLESQLHEAEKTVKLENPAQLQGFRSLIEKCRSLQRQGQLAHATKSKNTLLMSYQDEMRTPDSQHRFKRASTTVDRSRQPRNARRRPSYQHHQSLPSIGEEEPKTKASGNEEKERKHSETRPSSLKFSPEESRGKKSVVLMKGEDLKKWPPTGEISAKGLGYISSSDGNTPVQKASQTIFVRLPKKSALKKHVTNPNPIALSPLASPPAEASPRLKRKVKKSPKHTLSDKSSSRNPPLAQLKDDSKFTSSEFQADVEDFDAVSPISVTSMSEKTTTGDDVNCIVATNEVALKRESDSHTASTITVQAEVHVSAQERREPTPKQPSTASISSLIPPPPVAPRPSYHSSPVIHSSPPLPSPPSSSSPRTQQNAISTDIQQDSDYCQDLGHSNDPLLPRQRSSSSPSPPERDNTLLHGSSPCDTETDTDTLLPPRQWSSTSGSLPRNSKALSPNSPTTARRKKLSFERRRASSDAGKGGVIFLNMPSVGEDSDC